MRELGGLGYHPYGPDGPGAARASAPIRLPGRRPGPGQMPPTACRPARTGPSGAALPRMRGASRATWSPEAGANPLAAERAQGTASAPAPCSGHPAQGRVLEVASGGAAVGRAPAVRRQPVAAVAAPAAHRTPRRAPTGLAEAIAGPPSTPAPPVTERAGPRASSGTLSGTTVAPPRWPSFPWSRKQAHASGGAAARLAPSPGRQPTQTPEEPICVPCLPDELPDSGCRPVLPTNNREKSFNLYPPDPMGTCFSICRSRWSNTENPQIAQELIQVLFRVAS